MLPAMGTEAATGLTYKLAVLVFIEDEADRQLLILRNKQPNKGNWSPIGGKLEMGIGESPFECAARETFEEAGLKLETGDFHLFGMIAEKAYEGESHWLLFLFRCKKRIAGLPVDIEEGRFGLFSREELEKLPLPETDRRALWPIWDKYRDKFVALRADCNPAASLQLVTEQIVPL